MLYPTVQSVHGVPAKIRDLSSIEKMVYSQGACAMQCIGSCIIRCLVCPQSFLQVLYDVAAISSRAHQVL